jgi:hypothetical protein
VAARSYSKAKPHCFPRTHDHLLPLHVQHEIVLGWQIQLVQLLSHIFDIQWLWFQLTDASKNIFKLTIAFGNAE